MNFKLSLLLLGLALFCVSGRQIFSGEPRSSEEGCGGGGHKPPHDPCVPHCHKRCGLIPDPVDCTKFHRCEDGKIAETRTCPHGLQFNHGRRICDWPQNCQCPNECNPETTTTPEPETTTTDEPETTTHGPCPSGDARCEGFDGTFAEVPVVLPGHRDLPEDSLEEDGGEDSTEEGSGDDDDDTELDLSPHSDEQPRPCDPQCPPHGCPFVADPSDPHCNRFVRCRNGRAHGRGHCPRGLQFNPAIGNCDLPQNCHCVPTECNPETTTTSEPETTTTDEPETTTHGPCPHGDPRCGGFEGDFPEIPVLLPGVAQERF